MSYLQELREREHARKQSRTWAAAAAGQSGLPHQMLPTRQSGASRALGRPLPDEPCVECCETDGDDEPPDYVAPWTMADDHGSALELPNGEILYAWQDGSHIWVGESPDFMTFMTQSGSVTNERTVFEDKHMPCCTLFWLPDGRPALHVSWWWSIGQSTSDGLAESKMMVSNDQGETWSLLGVLQQRQLTEGGSPNVERRTAVGRPIRTSTGRLVVTSNYHYSGAAGELKRMGIWTSDNNGNSWTLRDTFGGGVVGGAYNTHHGRNIVEFQGQLFTTWEWDYGGYERRILRSLNDGATWSSHSMPSAHGSHMELYREPGEPSSLFRVNSSGETWASSNPTQSESWENLGLPEYDHARSRHLVQPLADRLVYIRNGVVSVVSGSFDMLRWKGIILDSPGEDAASWCVRIDPFGRLHAKELDGIRYRRFAFLSEIGGVDGLGTSDRLNLLNDVDVSQLADGVLLVWDEAAESWVALPADETHDHDDAYAVIGHDHDGDYAAPVHDHDYVVLAVTPPTSPDNGLVFVSETGVRFDHLGQER